MKVDWKSGGRRGKEKDWSGLLEMKKKGKAMTGLALELFRPVEYLSGLGETYSGCYRGKYYVDWTCGGVIYRTGEQ